MKCGNCFKTVLPDAILMADDEVRVLVYCERCETLETHVFLSNWTEVHNFRKWLSEQVDSWIKEAEVNGKITELKAKKAERDNLQ